MLVEAIKKIIKHLPLARSLAIRVNYYLGRSTFPGSTAYWEARYKKGRSSGSGSYNRLAEFKAEILNAFVEKNNIQSVIEYGCGDGNQLRLSKYPNYSGFDVASTAIEKCQSLFKSDGTKQFKLTSAYLNEVAELTLSLDVIYHLIEDSVFDEYMSRLFQSSSKYVIIYSSDSVEWNAGYVARHVKHRNFSTWVSEKFPHWTLTQTIPNRYPYSESDADNTSHADFFIYAKSD